MEHDFSKDVARDVLENFIERWRQQGHLDPVAKDGPPLLVNNIDFVKAVSCVFFISSLSQKINYESMQESLTFDNRGKVASGASSWIRRSFSYILKKTLSL